MRLGAETIKERDEIFEETKNLQWGWCEKYSPQELPNLEKYYQGLSEYKTFVYAITIRSEIGKLNHFNIILKEIEKVQIGGILFAVFYVNSKEHNSFIEDVTIVFTIETAVEVSLDDIKEHVRENLKNCVIDLFSEPPVLEITATHGFIGIHLNSLRLAGL